MVIALQLQLSILQLHSTACLVSHETPAYLMPTTIMGLFIHGKLRASEEISSSSSGGLWWQQRPSSNSSSSWIGSAYDDILLRPSIWRSDERILTFLMHMMHPSSSHVDLTEWRATWILTCAIHLLIVVVKKCCARVHVASLRLPHPARTPSRPFQKNPTHRPPLSLHWVAGLRTLDIHSCHSFRSLRSFTKFGVMLLLLSKLMTSIVYL